MLFFKKNISGLPDEDLLKKYRSTGKVSYFGELYNRYIPLLYGVCLKYLGDPDRSYDAVMDLFEELQPKIARYEIQCFKTWIHRVMKNHCFQLIRKEQLNKQIDIEDAEPEIEDVLSLLCREEASEERLAALRHCLEKLPPHQQQSIVCFFMEELSYVDIAEKTGFTLTKIKSYIQNGKRNLGICIKKQIA